MAGRFSGWSRTRADVGIENLGADVLWEKVISMDFKSTFECGQSGLNAAARMRAQE